MTKEEVINYGFNKFMKNPYWKGYYDNAPSDNCKRYIKLDFGMSDCPENEEAASNAIIADMVQMENHILTRDDISYMLKSAVGGYEKHQFEEMLKKIDERGK